MIEIDGSLGEGGGSVLRVALAISAVSGRPVHIYNIRARRPKPGLAHQHLSAAKAVSELVNARVMGLGLGSKEIFFEPGEAEGGRYKIEIGTAGSITLVLQALMPAAAFAKREVELEIVGGSDVPLAPPVDFLKNVTLPVLRRMGYRGEVDCIRRGHYPRGGGIVRARISPIQKLGALELMEPGKVTAIKGISHCVKLPGHVAVRQAHSAKMALLKAGYEAKIETEFYDPSEDQHFGPGSGITIWAETEGGAILGASSLGAPGKPAEKVGAEAAESLIAQLKTGCAVDRYLTDQLIVYMALSEGTSRISSAELTMHTLTNVELVKQILGVEVEVEGKLGESGKIKVGGIGFKRR